MTKEPPKRKTFLVVEHWHIAADSAEEAETIWTSDDRSDATLVDQPVWMEEV